MSDISELGLSSYEEQAYRALLATGPETARAVAERSDVPVGRIYDVLNGLVAREIVETRAGEPRLYAPVDPDDVVDRLLAERLAELETAADRYRELAATARSTLAPTPPVDGNVWLSAFGNEDAITLLNEQLSTVTERFVMAVGAPYETAPLEAYVDEIDVFVDHLETSSAITYDLLADRSLADTLAAALPSADDIDAELRIRQTDGVDVTFDVIDGREAYIDVPHPFVSGTRFGFVEIRDTTVAAEFETVFDTAWSTAEPLS